MSQTADRYSKALFELAQEQNKLEDIQNMMTDLRNLILSSIEFRMFLINPLLIYEEHCKVLKALFEGKFPDLGLKFLLFITFKKRLGLLLDMIISFDSMYLSHTRQLRAYVKTAMQVNDADKDFINGRLHDKFKQKMLIRWTVDPCLIGGFRIFAQGKVYDYSFKEQLNHFYQQTTQLV